MTHNEFIKSILTDAEQAKLSVISNDELTLNALRKLFLSFVYYQGSLANGGEIDPTRNFLLKLGDQIDKPNEILGAELRAASQAVMQLEAGFAALEQFQPKPEPSKGRKNEGR